MATLGVQIVGDAVGLKTALAEATAATERYAAASKAAFAGVSDASLQAQMAQYKLGKATEKYGEGTIGAAQATMAYRRQVDSLRESHLRAAQSIGRGLTTYVSAPTALIGFAAVKMGVEFQKQMLLLRTQAGDSTDSIRRLSDQVLKLAPTVGIGPTALSQGLYHLVSLGLRGSEAMNTLRTASIAAGMGVADLESVSTALGAAVVSGIQGAQNYDQAMATLVATVGAGNVRMEDLAGSLGNVLAPAVNAGVSLNELGAAMAVLTDRGMSAELAATRLRMTFSLIQAPSGAAQKALKDMGINAGALSAMIHQPNGLLHVLQTLHDAMNRVGNVKGSRDILQAFGGGRSGAGILTLVQSLDSGISSYSGKLAQITKQQQEYYFNTQAYMQSPSFKLHQSLATLETDLTQLGQKLTPLAVTAAATVNKLADAFGRLPGPVKAGLGGAAGLLALGGPLILGLVAATRAVHTLGKAFGMVPVEAGGALATTDAEIAGVGATANAAGSRVRGLAASLGSLKTLGVIAIGIELEIHRKQIAGAIGNAVAKATGSSGLGKAANVFERGAMDIASGGALLGADIGDIFHRHKGQTARNGLDPTRPTLFSPNGPLNPTSLLTGGRTKDKYVLGSDTAYRGGGSAGGHDPAKLVQKFVVPYALQLAQARSGLTQSTADDIQTLRNVVAYAKKQIDSGKLNHAALLDALNAEGSAVQQLYGFQQSDAKSKTKDAKKKADAAKKAKLFTLPADLQVAQARADAAAALSTAGNGPTSLQMKLAREVKSKAMKAINAHKLSLQGLIDAWNAVGQANQTIAQAANQTGTKQAVKQSSAQFVKGLRFLSDADKKAAEAKFAQVQAHNGFVPSGGAALGIHITVNGAADPETVARKVVKHIQQAQKRSPRQTRGRHGGNPLAVG